MSSHSPIQLRPGDPEQGRSALLRLLRIMLVAVIVLVTFWYVLDIGQDTNQLGELDISLAIGWKWVLLFSVTLACGVIAIDVLTPEKKIATLSGIFIGVVVGITASMALSFLIDRLAESYQLEGERIIGAIKMLFGIAVTYLAISIVLQTQDQFRLVIPYVEFSRQLRGVKPMLLDTSILIDGRVLDMARAGAIQAPIILPQCVLDELQALSDSSNKTKRTKGRRGLEIVSKLQREPRLDVTIDDTETPGNSVDQKLLALCAEMPAMLVTTDSGLDRVAGIQGLSTLNLNNLAQSLRPTITPGQILEVDLVRAGEQPTQGVGYLDDGAMVIAENGVNQIGQRVQVRVTSALQTNAGRLIFGRLDGETQSQAPAPEPLQNDAETKTPAQDREPSETEPDASAPSPAPRRRDPRKTSARNPRR